MCGIGGRLNFDRDEPADPALLRRMMRLMVHRGPDGGGEFVAGPVALGHRRLSIIDLDSGAQPMANEDGSVQIVFNGEIYNHVELRRRLVGRGHRFRSASDTEVIVHLYEELGERCVSELHGMFAFALWDQRRRRLVLARDRVGIKPLYLANTGRALVFASELKSLLVDPGVERRLHVPALDRFLTYHYLPGDETPIAGVRKLPPGHVLTVDTGGLEQPRIQQTRYWDLRFSQPARPHSLDASAQALHGLLDRSVRSHLISDVPVGVLLSGGVDSTAVLHFAARHSSRPLQTFTMGFDDGGAVADERPFARLGARACGTLHHETSMTAADFRDLLPGCIWHLDEPVCEPPAVALHVVARLARDAGVKVLLSGEGGDEAFAGYSDYRNLLALEAAKSAFAGAARPLFALGLRALGRAGWRRAAHYRSLLEPALADYYFSRTATPGTAFNPLKQGLYRDALRARLGPVPSDAPTRLLHAAVQDQPLLNRMLYVDTHSWLPDDLLVKADRMSMAASVELRVPLLDHAVLEFAAGLPCEHKLRGWTMKRVLRHALRGAVPRQVLSRRKAGFPVPYDRWLRHELSGFVADTVLQRNSFCDSCFERPELERLLAGHRRSGQGGKLVFSLLVLELWHRRFLGADAAQVFEATGAAASMPSPHVRPLAEAVV